MNASRGRPGRLVFECGMHTLSLESGTDLPVLPVRAECLPAHGGEPVTDHMDPRWRFTAHYRCDQKRRVAEQPPRRPTGNHRVHAPGDGESPV